MVCLDPKKREKGRFSYLLYLTAKFVLQKKEHAKSMTINLRLIKRLKNKNDTYDKMSILQEKVLKKLRL